MASVYTDAHRNACANAITALGNRIGLYVGSTRVGTVYADTTWGSAAKVNEGGTDKAVATGSTVTITVPGGTVSNGTVITHYGIHNGSTLLRREALPLSLTVNDGSQSFSVDVTPVFKYYGL
ncbi:hypothetical protein CL65_gp040 [Mycobacterium phage Patience]|uniref:Uncharacterized protein n=1 Tax=Mycobacterium phage Patience TaxID=1074308 RepID=G1JWF0_9CAUD|nr:hypothetical protein CL65_gp040 [Mycobacterium phage Patience]AEL97948.1 hypothetical protein PATIENCE_39 [Mycobacterium phage Patience]